MHYELLNFSAQPELWEKEYNIHSDRGEARRGGAGTGPAAAVGKENR